MTARLSRWSLAALIAFLCAAPLVAQDSQTLLQRAVGEFEQGRFAASVAAFDELITAMPSSAPHLWQRGIALYYAGRMGDCRRQFESHRTVNPDDVENAAWHFLCVAREQDAQAATSALLPVGPDARLPMQHVYRMLRGDAKPDEVLKAAGSDLAAQFYAQLYVGLYYEAVGLRDRARTHISAAAADRFAGAGYMHMVARVHVRAKP